MKRTLSIENAKIIFRNFSGKGSKYNRDGSRNFAIFLNNEKDVETLRADGWDIKKMKPKDGIVDEEDKYYLPVSVSFNNIPPNVFMITGNKKVQLNEDTISNLDYSEIENADLILTPYNWEVNGKTGVRAYLKTAYITIVQDEFASKYNFDFDDDEVPFK